jgi:phosphoglycerate dehydrogenase-like enzyme
MPRKKLVVLLASDSELPAEIVENAGRLANVVITRNNVDAARELKDAQGLFLWDLSSRLLDDTPPPPSLSWIHTATLGVDAVLTAPVVTSDIVVSNTRGVFERPIAEYVLGLLLAIAKDFRTTFANQRDEVWEWRPTHRIAGQKVVLIGPGAIGKEIHTLLVAAGMTVLPVGRHALSSDPHFGRIYSTSEATELLGNADAVVLSLPLTSVTRGFMTRNLISRMKPGASFINVGRGGLVDEPALIEALQSRRIGVAALDVFMQEPLPKGHALWRMDNVIVSPHMSGDTYGFGDLIASQFMENLARWSEGRVVCNVVDKQKLSASPL